VGVLEENNMTPWLNHPAAGNAGIASRLTIGTIGPAYLSRNRSAQSQPHL
jgi:hypothetical protein